MRTKAKKDFDLPDLKEEPGYGSLAESDLEELFFEETAPKTGGAINLPTIAGVGLIGVVFLHILQQIGLLPGSGLQEAFIVFPLFGILLVLLLGLMPRKRKRRRKRRRHAAKKKWESRQEKRMESEQEKEPHSTDGNLKTSIAPQLHSEKWRLPAKSRDKWIAGVCAGLAPHINMEVTVLRLIFGLSTVIFAGTIPIIAYLVLAILMHPPEDAKEPNSRPQK